MVLMGIGELGNFAAYGFAPASLIAPLGCVSVIGKGDLFFPLIHYPCMKAGGKVASSGSNSKRCLVKSALFFSDLDINSPLYTKCLYNVLKV